MVNRDRSTPSSIQEQLALVRKEYSGAALDEASASSDPFQQFRHWFDDAVKAQIEEPNAMVLATVAPSGEPSTRTVLLKDLEKTGFVFFTNYLSEKGQHIEKCAEVSLLFLWKEIERQIRIQGKATKVSRKESEEYFSTRPRGAQLAALASPQSRVLVQGRVELEKKVKDFEQKYQGVSVPCPETWGGYRVSPHSFEFWQGRESRLHDRLRYRRLDDHSWHIERLAP